MAPGFRPAGRRIAPARPPGGLAGGLVVRLRTGCDEAPLCEPGRVARLLRPLRQPGGPVAASPVWDAGRCITAAIGCDLHCAATDQFLAGHERRSAPRPPLCATDRLHP